MGKDIHEVRKYRDEVDRAPGSSGSSAVWRPEGRQIPLWVQRKIKAQTQRRWREAAEALYKWRYLGA